MDKKSYRDIKLVLMFFLIVIVILIILDLCNFRKVVPLSDQYDWLSFVGTMISGISVLIISIITVYQNEKLAQMNQRTLETTVMSTNYFRVMFRKDQKIEGDIYKIKIYEPNKIPLKKIRINSIIFQKGNDYNNTKEIMAEKDIICNLEYTDNENMDFYLANIKVNLLNENFTNKNEQYKMIIKMFVKNIFNVEIEYEYSICLRLIGKENNIINFEKFHSYEYIKSIKYIED